ncbi:hypothetical protein CEP54_012405 [Fusarium duplospermum]|uniref:B30.2/SPRY domain-containing protein n=1 Tax=Fusarium duplospermum TaxID=1325734 RepID=A0A428P8U8_9HYPO|nr:hypothetical protein CEP54_012405 [Fusarium duplospermum]
MSAIAFPASYEDFGWHYSIPVDSIHFSKRWLGAQCITGLGSKCKGLQMRRGSLIASRDAPYPFLLQVVMLRRITTTTGVRLLVLAVLVAPVAAADDAEFAFNLLTDVAPILALFGDAFAKQFMSESLTWVDHLIFAMVPLGIITAITSAVRVQGMQIAKAFVGRARENRALAEIELMSSTSGEVCELFNGNSIVRAMGKPKIEQFLIFPDEYDELKEKYKAFDDGHDGEEPKDKSCGIHSLQTAIFEERGESQLMECKAYSAHSVTVIQECSKSALAFSRRLWQLPLSTVKGLLRPAPPTPPGDEERPEGEPGHTPLPSQAEDEGRPETASTGSGHLPLPREAVLALTGPPNLQLNLSSDHFDQNTLKKRYELILAAVAAVLLQAGLIVVAATTAYHLKPGSFSLFETKVYGFPCYAVGSVLLSIGTGLCSFIVEHSTVEHSWEADNCAGPKTDGKKAKIEGKKAKPQDNAPRLVWVQRYQTVNDQSFQGYVILAGPKRRVITSRRDDDIGKHHASEDSASRGSHSKSDGKNEGFWQWLTVGAALAAGFGFIAQFMGLRGLAFPCSIAQLGAIFIMALIRASIRRRLGRVPAHCLALEGYELDFLATQLVFDSEVRASHQRRKGEENYGKDKQPGDFCRWKVKTANPKQPTQPKSNNRANVSEPAQQHNATPESKQQQSSATSESAPQHPSTASKTSRAGLNSDTPSSQQLIRVRERLSDLCQFTSKSTESALSLAQSIELFMNSFSSLPLGEDRSNETLLHVNWRIEVTKFTSTSMSGDLDTVKIPVERKNSRDKWRVDVAKIDAILSLWMASIEAKKVKDEKDAQESKDSRQGLGKGRPATDPTSHSGVPLPDWRRTKVGDDSRCSFGRIIGDNFNDEVLKRDISWWVDSIVAEQSDPAVEDDNNSGDEGSDDGSDGGSDSRGNGRRWSRARNSGINLIIGFNGNKSHTEPARELGITSNDCLHTILAQHLFTSFMWTVVEFLPRNCLNPGIDEMQQEVEIEGPKAFESYDFDQTWLRPRLRHRQLTKIVRKMESFGLGSTTDILLCMIPALSSVHLLPNQAILKLMPRVGSGRGWVETAICYRKLLETIKTEKVSEEDQFSVNIVVASIDFLSFAYEPYDERMKPPEDLDDELRAITQELLSPKFIAIMERLEPVYHRQGRYRLSNNILQYSAGSLKQRPFSRRKTFGWGRQALHIASKLGHEKVATELLKMGSRSDELDDAGKCPADYFVQSLKEKSQHNNDSEANDSPGKMEFKHLSKEDFDLVLKFEMEPHYRYNNGKTFLHIAVEVASDDNIRTLVREKGFDVEARDDHGRTPLHCAILSDRPSVAITLIGDLQAKTSAKDSGNITPLMLAAQENLIEVAQALLDLCDPGFVNEVDDDKKAAIHYVRGREIAGLLIKNGCNLLTTDSYGRTALHAAIDRKDDVALYLLSTGQVQTEPFDKNESLLITACKNGFSEIVPGILERWPHIINTEDAVHGLLPISWACVNGHSDVVAKLLQDKGSERVDVNRTARGWRDYTPLHFAVEAGDSKSLTLLLEQPSTELHRESEQGDTPLRWAVRRDCTDAARMLFQDPRTTPEERLRCIQEFNSPSFSAFHSIIGDILGTFADRSLVPGYFLSLFDHRAAADIQESINKLVDGLKRGGWKKLTTPYHLAILLGDDEFLQILKEEDVPRGGLDEDNWSLVDYAKRFDRDGTLTSLVDSLQPLPANLEHKHREPTALICPFDESKIKVTSCTAEGHSNCSKVHDVEVIERRGSGLWACMRSDHSIPPSRKYFYFEVEVLRNSESRLFRIGFCGSSNIDDQMPGWFKGSWGYNGYNGALFIESSTGVTPSSDFGEAGKSKSGDVVGVCLNIDTGQGFCTRNGKKLNMGNDFEGREESFKYETMRRYGLVSTLLGSVGTASAADYVARDMDTWCITYLSTYLAPVSDQPGSSPSGLSTFNWNSSLPATSGTDDRTSLISESAGTSAVRFESSSVDMALTETQTDSSTLSFGSTTGSLTDIIITSLMSTTNLNTPAFPTSSGIIEPPGRSVIFLVQASDNQKRAISKRATGGFVGQDNPDVCTFASTYNLAEGQLFTGGVPVYYSGEEFKELGGEGEGSPVSGSITRTFETDGRTLVFRNSELPNGEAGFCQDSSGQVYLTFTTDPSDCVPVTLGVYDVAQCQNGRLVGLDTSTTSEIVSETSTSTETSSRSTGGEESTTAEAAVSTEENLSSSSQTEPSGRSSEASTFEASTTVSSEVINSSASTSSIQSSILSIDPTTGTLSSMETEVTINTSTGSASQPSSEPTGFESFSTLSSSEQTTPDTSTTTSDSSSEIDAITAESSSEIYTSTTEFSSETEGTTTQSSSETEGTTTQSSSEMDTSSTEFSCETEATTAQSSSEMDTSTTEATTTTGQETTAADTTTDLAMTTTSEFSSDLDTSTTEATTTSDSETTIATTEDTTTDDTSTTALESSSETEATTTQLSSEMDTSTTEDITTTAPETSTADTTTDAATTTSSAPEPDSCASLSNPYSVDGSNFDLFCNHDVISGVSIGQVQANSFAQCVFFCAESSNCAAIQFTKSNRQCQGFSSITGTTGDNLYDVAVKKVPAATTSEEPTP